MHAHAHTSSRRRKRARLRARARARAGGRRGALFRAMGATRAHLLQQRGQLHQVHIVVGDRLLRHRAEHWRGGARPRPAPPGASAGSLLVARPPHEVARATFSPASSPGEKFEPVAASKLSYLTASGCAMQRGAPHSLGSRAALVLLVLCALTAPVSADNSGPKVAALLPGARA